MAAVVSNLHCNLLRVGELRHEGPVRVAFFLAAAGWSVAGLLLLALFLWGWTQIQRELVLRNCRARWADLKPHCERARKLEAALVQDQILLREAAGWRRVRLPLDELLRATQLIAPAGLQFVCLEAENIFFRRRPDGEPVQRLRYVIDARVGEQQGHNTFDRFYQALRQDAALRRWLAEVRPPAFLVPDGGAASVVEILRSFELECYGHERRMFD